MVVGIAIGIAAALLSGCSSSPSERTGPAAQGGYAGGLAGDPWASHIAEASQRFDVPEPWIRAVMKVESGGRTHMNGRPIVSRAGAMGLMQVMPSTYEELRVKHGLGSDPFEPRDNILAGTAYLREMYEKFGSPGFLAAYNAGPGRYGEYLTGDRGLPSETRNYVAMISPQIDGIHPSRRVTDTLYAAATPPAIQSRTIPSRTVVAAAAAPPRARPVVTASAAPVPIAPVQIAPVPITPVPAAPIQQVAMVPANGPAGDWGIQVGAFRSPTESNKAVEDARRAVPDLLTPARVYVMEVNTPAGRLYRARLLGVTSASADRACARLTSQGSACMTVSPS
ncbi:lytic transglycosylase domain-containing protein [Skermanella sp. TT6]|uniref:Lytic transglycosylase domain-containing protein n=1 Tax=Skermanella cutis TaxID=2775420 RepID=A0ABX7B9W2_9PROT|nr:lytic transglycosylase domain-containing protein [Skermanella sp. TT6]QQP91151.1 lytic transglycosylase domain-containing protein [Skermanella sp. TT6]